MKKSPITSTANVVRIGQPANRTIVPPAHVALDESDVPFFNSIIAEFAKAEWSDHQIELAAKMARLMSDTEAEYRAMRVEGSVITNSHGNKVINPRRSVIQMNVAAILNFRRSLSLNANLVGDRASRNKRIKGAKQAESQFTLHPLLGGRTKGDV
jgi:hypothetical protein